MSISSSRGTPVACSRLANTSSNSHHSDPQECALINHTMNDLGNSIFTDIVSLLYQQILMCSATQNVCIILSKAVIVVGIFSLPFNRKHLSYNDFLEDYDSCSVLYRSHRVGYQKRQVLRLPTKRFWKCKLNCWKYGIKTFWQRSVQHQPCFALATTSWKAHSL